MTAFTPAPSIPTGQVTLDWNTEDRLETVSLGDTLGIGGRKTSRILMGHPAVSASMETQVSGCLVANKVIGSFSSVYDVFNTPGITASQDAIGTITGTGTAFVVNMEKGGVVLWENGSVTPIIKYVSPTELKYPSDYIGALPVLQPQRFKIYYNGCYMECPNCVLGAGTMIAPTLVTQNINVVPSAPSVSSTGTLNIKSVAGQTAPSFSISNSSGDQQIRMYTSDSSSMAPAIQCPVYGTTDPYSIFFGMAPSGTEGVETITIGGEIGTFNVFINTNQAYLQFNDTLFVSCDIATQGHLTAALTAVASPSNEHAGAAGVNINQFYKGTDDPAIVYIRTA